MVVHEDESTDRGVTPRDDCPAVETANFVTEAQMAETIGAEMSHQSAFQGAGSDCAGVAHCFVAQLAEMPDQDHGREPAAYRLS
jgi:hypothetical protein